MNKLINVPKSRSLANNNSNLGFPTLSNWLDDIFNHEIPSVVTTNYNTENTLPKVNIKETNDDFTIEMAVPGLKKSDFNIEIDNKVLSISSELKEEDEQKEENYTRREFGYSSFKRTFALPDSVDDSKIDAKYEDGILYIQLPKREEAKQKPPRSIKIS